MSEDKKTFHIGICMAGAVSAGAYTAGVMDYLLEAFEQWQRAKQLQGQGKLSGIPDHNVVVDVLGGASAGGMTAAITAAAIQNNFPSVTPDQRDNPQVTQKNPLYNSWVNLKETDDEKVALDMMDYMLSVDDIEKDPKRNFYKEVRAGLNSNFIEELASGALDNRVDKPYQRPYIASDLDIFSTVTNLRGFAYKVTFQTSAGSREHRMKMHRDYAFFKLTNSHTLPLRNDNNDASAETPQDLPDDGRIPVNFSTGLNTEILKQAAMATGAFPIGLESRELNRHRKYIERNKYLNLMLSGEKGGDVKYEFLPEDDFLTLNVDGGVINNEPYELTQNLLDDRRRANDKDYKANIEAGLFDSAVLMIDPFPNDDDAGQTGYVPQKAWKNVLPAILSAMRGQLMMKDEQVRRAYLSDDYTRFLVMPVRENEKFAIACGSLGGFGGFFSKAFRRHDYFLGRRNCQRFLQKHFSAPEDANNPILTFGYRNSKYGIDTGDQSKRRYLPLIPDLRIEGDDISGFRIVKPLEEVALAYPKIKLSYILGLESKLEKRIKCLLDNISNAAPVEKPIIESAVLSRIRKKSWLQRQTGWVKGKLADLYLLVGKQFGKGVAAKFCIDAIIADMEQRGLIEDDLKKK